MIDPVIFAAEMTILQNRFPGARNMTAETIARYLDYLDERMTTEEFVHAAREIFNQDTFWPSPARFITAAQGDPEQEANSAWFALFSAANRGETPKVDALQREALRAIGGFGELARAEGDYRQERLRKAFESAYVNAAKNRRQPALEAPEEEPVDVLALFGMTKDDE